MADLIVIDFETEMVGDYGDAFPRIISIGGTRWADLRRSTRSLNVYVDTGRPLLPRPPEFQAEADAWNKRAKAGTLDSFPVALEKLEAFITEGPAVTFAWPSHFEVCCIKRALEHWRMEEPKWLRYVRCLRSYAEALAGRTFKSFSEYYEFVFNQPHEKRHVASVDAAEEGDALRYHLQTWPF